MIRPIVAKGFHLSKLRVAGVIAFVLLAGCQKNQLLVKRSVCPAVAVPNYTGDLTTFADGWHRKPGRPRLSA